MIDGLIRWSLNNRLFVLALAAGFLIWGGYLVSAIPVDVLPDLTAPTVTVLVEGRGMAPTEMESLVTFPIEAAVNGASGVRRVRSATAVGVAVIWVEFEWGEDIYRARQTVTEKLATIAGALPPQVEPPVLAPVSSVMGEILFIALESDTHSPLEVRTTADTVLRRRLLAVPGVSQVTPIGGGEKQYQILIHPERLRAYNLSLSSIEEAARQSTLNTTAGFRVAGGQEYLVQGIGRARNIEDIGNSVVAVRDGRPILVRDVADTQVGEAIKRGEGSHSGKPAVILGIQTQPGANTLELTRTIDSVLDDIQKSLPQGMKISKDIFRQSDFIEIAIHNLTGALRDGAILVILVVLLFLANFRAAAITLLAIPLSLVAAFVGLKYSGATINSMTLGGMAIAIGALVDDAIIYVENVFRRLRENARKPEEQRRPAGEVVYEASTEIRASIVFATLIIVLVFLPLFFLAGVEGRLLHPLGFAYVVALFASLAVALTVTPALCSYFLPHSRAVRSGAEPNWITWLKRLYRRQLGWFLNHSRLVLGASALALAGALVCFTWVGRAFLPEFNEGSLTISAVTLPGTSLAESDKLGRQIEAILLSVPEVSATARRTGRAELDEHVQGVESAEIDVSLRMKDRGKAEVLADIRQRLSLVPGMNIQLGQPISHRIDHMLSGTRANVAAKIFGDDLATLRLLAKEVEAQMHQVPGMVDISVEQQTNVPTLAVRFDRTALARHGVQAATVARAIETANVGTEVAQVFEGQLAFPLVVRFVPDSSDDLEAIRNVMIEAGDGTKVPLGALADIGQDRGPNFVSRENVQRKIVVMSNVAGRDLRGAVDDLSRRVEKNINFSEGYHIEYGGQFESETEALRRLTWLGIAAVAGILLILAIAFRSFGDAFIVMLNLPLALIGGVAGVFVSGGILSVASLVGFITVFGIATRNGIMMVSHIKHLMEEEGVADFREAVVRGATERLLPILMTAMATGLALVPLALGAGKPGSEIESPMATVILFGLVSSTALNMIVVPAMYLTFGRRPAVKQTAA